MANTREQHIATSDIPRVLDSLHTVSDEDLIDAWLGGAEKVGGDFGGERDIAQAVIKELMHGVMPTSEFRDEPEQPADPEAVAHLRAVSRELGVRIVWGNMPEVTPATQAVQVHIAQAEGTA